MKFALCLLTPAALLATAPLLAQTPTAPTPSPKPALPAASAPAATASGAAPATAETTAAPAGTGSQESTIPPTLPEPAPAPPTVPPAPAAPTEPAVASEALPREPSSLELFGMVAPTVVEGEPANPQLTNSFRRVGIYGEAGVAYRSKYFLDPFISVGYGTLASGKTELPDATYGGEFHPGGTLHQHLGTWFISPGVTSDLWRFRLRFGIGLAVVKQSFRDQGEDNTATQLALAWQAGLAFNFYQVPRFRLDADARFVQAKGVDITFWALGVTARGDLITY